VILRRYPLGESDRLVVMLTPGNGLVRANAKGQRRSKKRFSGIIDLLYFLDVDLLKRKSDILTMENARLAAAYRPLSEDVMLFAAGFHVAEVAALFASDHHSDPEAFSALTAGLEALCRGADPGRVSRIVELHTLRAAGIAPRLTECAVTDTRFKPTQSVMFDPRHGGAVIPAKAGPMAVKLAPAAREWMTSALAADFAAALALPQNGGVSRQIREATAAMIAFHSGRTMRARRFAESVRQFLRGHRKS